MYQAPLWLTKCSWFQVLSRTHQTLGRLHQGKALFVLWPQSCISPVNSVHIKAVLMRPMLDSFSTHRAILFLPNPGYHPWSDETVSSTSRWWCLQQYTYSRRISLWNIQHEKCLCKFFNRWYWIANKCPIFCCVWQLPVYAHCMVAQKCNTRFSY